MSSIPFHQLKAFAAKPKKYDDEEEDDSETQDEGDDEGDKTKQIVERAKKQIENGPDAELVALVAGYEGEEGGPSGVDAESWEKACETVKEVDGEDVDEDEEHWLLVAHVYKAMGGELSSEEDEDEDED